MTSCSAWTASCCAVVQANRSWASAPTAVESVLATRSLHSLVSTSTGTITRARPLHRERLRFWCLGKSSSRVTLRSYGLRTHSKHLADLPGSTVGVGDGSHVRRDSLER